MFANENKSSDIDTKEYSKETSDFTSIDENLDNSESTSNEPKSLSAEFMDEVSGIWDDLVSEISDIGKDWFSEVKEIICDLIEDISNGDDSDDDLDDSSKKKI